MNRKPKKEEMQVIEVAHGKTGIYVEWGEDTPDEIELKITGKEMPLPAYEKARAALAAVAGRMCDLNKSYVTSKRLEVVRMLVSYNLHKARSVRLKCSATLKGGRTWVFNTPKLRIDEALEGEKSVQVELGDADVEAIEKFISSAADYACGKRSQALLEGLDEPEEEAEAELPLD